MLLFGESGTGKSTLAVDLGLHIVSGMPWRGHPVQRGMVLHVAGEGMHGLRLRLAAAVMGGRVAKGVPYALIDTKLDLVQPVDRADLIERIDRAESEVGEKLALIIIDTMARSFGIDENDGFQMRAAIAACDDVRIKTESTVLLIHHTGKDTSKGARGHSSLRAAVDSELLVEGRCNPRTLTVTKQRDLPTADPMGFDLVPIVVLSGNGVVGPQTACVIHHSDTPATKSRRKEPSGKNQQLLLGALREHVRASGCDLISSPDLREIAKAQGLDDRRRVLEARESLERDGWLLPTVGGSRLAGDRL